MRGVMGSEFSLDLGRLRDEVAAVMEARNLAGMGVGVVLGDEVVMAEGFGLADVVKGEAFGPRHRQRIASITKTMVGLCVMALVEEGRLSLRDRVVDLLPEILFHGERESLTVWHLLTHTGGIGEAPTLEDMGKAFDKLFGESEPGVPLAELYRSGVTLEVRPGTKWAYANHGFVLLGEIVSRLEGADLAEVVRRRVFEPLGMKDSDLLDEPHPDLSHGYSAVEELPLLRVLGVQLESEEPVDGHNLPGKFVRVWGNAAAGGGQSTVTDMCAYASALLRASKGVVRPETFAEMVKDQWRPDRRLPGWGLSFALRTVGGHRMFGHGGSAFGGWNSYLAVFPDLDAGLVLHTNSWSDAFDTAVTPRLLRAFLGYADPAFTGRPEAAVLASAPGVYELPEPGLLTNFRPQYNTGRVQIRAEDGALVMYSRRGAWKDGVRLAPVDPEQPDFFAIVSGDGNPASYMALLRDEAGRVTGLRLPQLVEMYRTTEVKPWV